MLGPDGIDRVQYVPPDKVIQTQHADPDKRQKFSRALEEEEEELERRRKKHPQDQVELETDANAATPSDDDGKPSREQPTGNDKETLEEPKHVDVKA